jgi:hypothetical protein
LDSTRDDVTGGDNVTGVELAVGAVVAWAINKARRAGHSADEIVDEAIDAGMEKVHDVVFAKIGDDTSLAKLELEAATTAEVSERTRDRVALALADAVEDDPEFAEALAAALREMRPLPAQVNTTGHSVAGTIHGSNVMIGGNVGGSVHIKPAEGPDT